jgi:hypothetical protein
MQKRTSAQASKLDRGSPTSPHMLPLPDAGDIPQVGPVGWLVKAVRMPSFHFFLFKVSASAVRMSKS